MSDISAYCFHRVFDAEPAKTFTFDRHYLLYAAKGTLRLETDNKTWTLPPSRAAWIAADNPIIIDIPQPVTCCSILFQPGFISAPTDSCKIFDVTPLAREMILECRKWGPDTPKLNKKDALFFQTLANVCIDLACNPCNTWLPVAKSDALRRAIAYTEKNLSSDPAFAEVASNAYVSERTLARRFADETGMTWRQIQRRMRMIRAIEMLADDTLQITGISLDVGYNSVSAFNAAFKDFTGVNPREYRRQANTA